MVDTGLLRKDEAAVKGLRLGLGCGFLSGILQDTTTLLSGTPPKDTLQFWNFQVHLSELS